MRAAGFAEYALVVFGAFLVIGGVFLRGGIAGLTHRGLDRLRARLVPPEPPRRTSTAEVTIDPIAGKALEVSGVVKEFGGVRAVSEVSLTAAPGKVTGLIGGNGSGKTTLLNIVSGFYRADHGTVALDGRPIGDRAPHLVARQGVARTFQTPMIPRSLTTLDVLATARYASHYTGILSAVLRLPRYRRQRALDREKALNVLRVLGIEHLGRVPAESLPLGSRRMVEVARALVAEPAVLLLDEPASGLDEGEVADLGRLVRRVADLGTTVLLVEHNFALICGVSDVVHVLESGRLIASGAPAEIQRHPDVVRSYLGEEAIEMEGRHA
ncbi:ABC transporter ATP-binding protein [Actinomadura sp. SCN-SB]|uniref:ABC transporter ATP-binding protein n=1 Tax=Actinomadura sp. SCN-SB TaxID=3373092 RepID=UPI0037518891